MITTTTIENRDVRQLNIRLRVDIFEALHRLAREEGESVSVVARRALRRELEPELAGAAQ